MRYLILVKHSPPEINPAAHGTVIALFVSRCAGIAPFPLWQRLGLPSYLVLALPTYNLSIIADTVDLS